MFKRSRGKDRKRRKRRGKLIGALSGGGIASVYLLKNRKTITSRANNLGKAYVQNGMRPSFARVKASRSAVSGMGLTIAAGTLLGSGIGSIYKV